jgi:hypothetical protein
VLLVSLSRALSHTLVSLPHTLFVAPDAFIPSRPCLSTLPPLLFLGSPRIHNVRPANSKKFQKLHRTKFYIRILNPNGYSQHTRVKQDATQLKYWTSPKGTSANQTLKGRMAHQGLANKCETNHKSISRRWTRPSFGCKPRPPLKQLHTVHTYCVCATDKNRTKQKQKFKK